MSRNAIVCSPVADSHALRLAIGNTLIPYAAGMSMPALLMHGEKLVQLVQAQRGEMKWRVCAAQPEDPGDKLRVLQFYRPVVPLDLHRMTIAIQPWAVRWG